MNRSQEEMARFERGKKRETENADASHDADRFWTDSHPDDCHGDSEFSGIQDFV